MRAAHRGYGQPAIHKWDVYNAIPPLGYRWDVYNAVPKYKQMSSPNPPTINIPFSAGYYKTNGWTFNSATGKFIFDNNVYLKEVKADISPVEMRAYLGTEPGTEVSEMYYGANPYESNKTETHWVIDDAQIRYYSAVDYYTKGTATGDSVYSALSGAYPQNGEASGLWYVYVSYDAEHHRGDATGETVISYYPDEYPASGYDAATDKWYERRQQ